MKTDFLVIGTGLAGLNYILQLGKIDSSKKIIVVTKSNSEESNTSYAQGGVAIVHDPKDSFSSHINDTLVAGDGVCDPEIVEMVVKEAPNCLYELESLGVDFDKNESGELDLALEGGHSMNRVVHFQDSTGYEIQKKLLLQVIALPNVQLLDHHFALELITSNNKCDGAVILDEKTNEVRLIQSKITLVATGGIGQAYVRSTNPLIATGDGIAMAYRAGAIIRDLEFIQFHPTALYTDSTGPAFLISEAVRGFGAELKTLNGTRFMQYYDSRGDLAPRDIVARAIHNELQKSDARHVLLDCTALDQIAFKKHFPTIVQECLSNGIDISTDMIPVSPAQHYICGGISTNQWGESSVENLFACGESARTGLHGANRLASNSLLEAYVFSSKSAQKSIEIIDSIPHNEISYYFENNSDSSLISKDNLQQLRFSIQRITDKFAGIVRCTEDLKRATEDLSEIVEMIESHYQLNKLSIELNEMRNLATVSTMIIQASLIRRENKGGYYNTDYA